MRWFECSEYDDCLFVAVSKKTCAIYFASEKAKKFEELFDEFEQKYPDLKGDVVVWYGYKDMFWSSSIKAMENGAFLPEHIIGWQRSRQTPFEQYIYEVELAYVTFDDWAGNKETYQFSSSEKANKFVAKKIAEDKSINEINLYMKTLDTNERELTKSWSRYEDKYGRMRKVKKGEQK